MMMTILRCCIIISGLSGLVGGFAPSSNIRRPAANRMNAAPSDSDFDKPIPVTDENTVDPNFYNVGAELAVELLSVSVVAETKGDRVAGKPFADCKSKDHYVDDVSVTVARDGGLGMELLELAGGRDDDYGLTIITGVSGNAERAGVVPGDSIASVEVKSTSAKGNDVEETTQVYDCECRNFDATIGLLGGLPAEVESVVLNLKRVRRWPKLNVVVEYPPIQCADPKDNKVSFDLVAGENLKRALQSRGIVFEDRDAKKCDFCGQKCTVQIDTGLPLLNPMGLTEQSIMRQNPKCRLSCKAVVGHNMQEGNIRLKINLNEWRADEKQSTSVFSSR